MHEGNRETRWNIQIGTFHTRGLKRKFPTVHEQAERVQIIGLCDTWIRPDCRELAKGVCTCKNRAGRKELQGFVGVPFIVNQIIPFEVLTK